MPTRSDRIEDLASATRSGRWFLSRVRLPLELIPDGHRLPQAGDGLVFGDLEISGDQIVSIRPHSRRETRSVDLDGSIVLPGLVDCHTHLDTGHIWPRARNPDGGFQGAIDTVAGDQKDRWTPEDMRARMRFALDAAHAHGTVAVRTHLDCWPSAAFDPWPVFHEVAAAWRGRIDLQAAALITLGDVEQRSFIEGLARQVLEAGAALGAFVQARPDDLPHLPDRLDTMLRLAERFGLPVDFHVDETLDPHSCGLKMVAEAVLRTGFEGPVLCGHCVAPSSYDLDDLARTLDLTARAGLGVVSLPLCNAYLLDRSAGRTPRRRAMAPVHEIRAAGIEVAIGSDNTRDPFNAYGDLDLLEIYRFATLSQHLDHPVGSWPATIAATPSRLIGQPDKGRIAPGRPADLVILNSRGWSEFNARPQSDRIFLRNGLTLSEIAPEYRMLDRLEGIDDLSVF
ncbi:MAG: cytosine deaminase [Pseudomonadota bacterium]